MNRRALGAALLVAATLGMAGADRLAAQSGGDGFLFKQPRLSLTLKGGANFPRAASGNGTQSLWDLTREELTVETGDLTGSSIIGEVAFRASERVDVTFSVGGTRSEVRSEFRDWVGTDDLPIEQTTEFSTVPFTVGVRAYLLPRGRAVGSLAWIPARFRPYVGIAGGVVGYTFRQHGEFVDYETWDIFRDNFLSKGRGATVHLTGGVDLSLNRHLLVVAEGRYGYASAGLGTDFVGFPDLDLSGFQATAGFSLQF